MTKISKLVAERLPEDLKLPELIRRLNDLHGRLPPLPYELSKGSDLTGQNRTPTASQVLRGTYGLVVPGYLEIAPFRSFEVAVGAHFEVAAVDGGPLPSYALASEPFLTVGTTAGLSAERALTAGVGMQSVDGGAGGAFTLNVDWSPAYFLMGG